MRRDAEQSAAVVQNHVGFRKSAQQVGKVVELRIEHPRLERQLRRGKTRKAFAEHRVQHQVARDLVSAELRGFAGIPDGAVAYAFEAAVARRHQRIEHRLHFVAQHQVRMADDARAQARFAIVAAGAGGRDAVDEFDFADGLHFFRAIVAVHHAGLDEHRRDDVVPAVHVC